MSETTVPITLPLKIDASGALPTLEKVKDGVSELRTALSSLRDMNQDSVIPGFVEGMSEQIAITESNVDNLENARKMIMNAQSNSERERYRKSFVQMYNRAIQSVSDMLKGLESSKDLGQMLTDDIRGVFTDALRPASMDLRKTLRAEAISLTNRRGNQTDETIIEAVMKSAALNRDFSRHNLTSDKGFTEQAMRKYMQAIYPVYAPKMRDVRYLDWDRMDATSKTRIEERLPSGVFRERFNHPGKLESSIDSNSHPLTPAENRKMQVYLAEHPYMLREAEDAGIVRRENGNIYYNPNVTRGHVGAFGGGVIEMFASGIKGGPSTLYGSARNLSTQETMHALGKSNLHTVNSEGTAEFLVTNFPWIKPVHVASQRQEGFKPSNNGWQNIGKVTGTPRIDAAEFYEVGLGDIANGVITIPHYDKETPYEERPFIRVPKNMMNVKLAQQPGADPFVHNGLNQNEIYVRLPIDELSDYETTPERIAEIREQMVKAASASLGGTPYVLNGFTDTHMVLTRKDLVDAINKTDPTFLRNGNPEHKFSGKNGYELFARANAYRRLLRTEGADVEELYGTDLSDMQVVVGSLKAATKSAGGSGLDGQRLVSKKYFPQSFQHRDWGGKGTSQAIELEELWNLYPNMVAQADIPEEGIHKGDLVFPRGGWGDTDENPRKLILRPGVGMIEDETLLKTKGQYAGKSQEQINKARTDEIRKYGILAKTSGEGFNTPVRYISSQEASTLQLTPEAREYFKNVAFKSIRELDDVDAVKRILFSGDDPLSQMVQDDEGLLTSQEAQNRIYDYRRTLAGLMRSGNLILPHNQAQYSMLQAWVPDIFNALIPKDQLTPEQKKMSLSSIKGQRQAVLTNLDKNATLDDVVAYFGAKGEDLLQLYRNPSTVGGNILAANAAADDFFQTLAVQLGIDPKALYASPSSEILERMQTADFDGDTVFVQALKKDATFRSIMLPVLAATAEEYKRIKETSGYTDKEQEERAESRTGKYTTDEGREYDLDNPEDAADWLILSKKRGAAMGLSNAVSLSANQYPLTQTIARAKRDVQNHYDAVSNSLFKEDKTYDPTSEEWAVARGGSPFYQLHSWIDKSRRFRTEQDEATGELKEVFDYAAFNRRKIDSLNFESIHDPTAILAAEENYLYSNLLLEDDPYFKLVDDVFEHMPKVDTSTDKGRFQQAMRDLRRSRAKGEWLVLDEETEKRMDQLAALAYTEISDEVFTDNSIPDAHKEAEIKKRYAAIGGQAFENEVDINKGWGFTAEYKRNQAFKAEIDAFAQEAMRPDAFARANIVPARQQTMWERQAAEAQRIAETKEARLEQLKQEKQEQEQRAAEESAKAEEKPVQRQEEPKEHEIKTDTDKATASSKQSILQFQSRDSQDTGKKREPYIIDYDTINSTRFQPDHYLLGSRGDIYRTKDLFGLMERFKKESKHSILPSRRNEDPDLFDAYAAYIKENLHSVDISSLPEDEQERIRVAMEDLTSHDLMPFAQFEFAVRQLWDPFSSHGERVLTRAELQEQQAQKTQTAQPQVAKPTAKKTNAQPSGAPPVTQPPTETVKEKHTDKTKEQASEETKKEETKQEQESKTVPVETKQEKPKQVEVSQLTAIPPYEPSEAFRAANAEREARDNAAHGQPTQPPAQPPVSPSTPPTNPPSRNVTAHGNNRFGPNAAAQQAKINQAEQEAKEARARADMYIPTQTALSSIRNVENLMNEQLGAFRTSIKRSENKKEGKSAAESRLGFDLWKAKTVNDQIAAVLDKDNIATQAIFNSGNEGAKLKTALQLGQRQLRTAAYSDFFEWAELQAKEAVEHIDGLLDKEINKPSQQKQNLEKEQESLKELIATREVLRNQRNKKGFMPLGKEYLDSTLTGGLTEDGREERLGDKRSAALTSVEKAIKDKRDKIGQLKDYYTLVNEAGFEDTLNDLALKIDPSLQKNSPEVLSRARMKMIDKARERLNKHKKEGFYTEDLYNEHIARLNQLEAMSSVDAIREEQSAQKSVKDAQAAMALERLRQDTTGLRPSEARQELNNYNKLVAERDAYKARHMHDAGFDLKAFNAEFSDRKLMNRAKAITEFERGQEDHYFTISKFDTQENLTGERLTRAQEISRLEEKFEAERDKMAETIRRHSGGAAAARYRARFTDDYLLQRARDEINYGREQEDISLQMEERQAESQFENRPMTSREQRDQIYDKLRSERNKIARRIYRDRGAAAGRDYASTHDNAMLRAVADEQYNDIMWQNIYSSRNNVLSNISIATGQPVNPQDYAQLQAQKMRRQVEKRQRELRRLIARPDIEDVERNQYQNELNILLGDDFSLLNLSSRFLGSATANQNIRTASQGIAMRGIARAFSGGATASLADTIADAVADANIQIEKYIKDFGLNETDANALRARWNPDELTAAITTNYRAALRAQTVQNDRALLGFLERVTGHKVIPAVRDDFAVQSARADIQSYQESLRLQARRRDIDATEAARLNSEADYWDTFNWEPEYRAALAREREKEINQSRRENRRTGYQISDSARTTAVPIDERVRRRMEEARERISDQRIKLQQDYNNHIYDGRRSEYLTRLRELIIDENELENNIRLEEEGRDFAARARGSQSLKSSQGLIDLTHDYRVSPAEQTIRDMRQVRENVAQQIHSIRQGLRTGEYTGREREAFVALGQLQNYDYAAAEARINAGNVATENAYRYQQAITTPQMQALLSGSSLTRQQEINARTNALAKQREEYLAQQIKNKAMTETEADDFRNLFNDYFLGRVSNRLYQEDEASRYLRYTNQEINAREQQRLAFNKQQYSYDDYTRQRRNQYRRDFISRATIPINERRIALGREVEQYESQSGVLTRRQNEIERALQRSDLTKERREELHHEYNLNADQISANAKSLEEAKRQMEDLSSVGTQASAVFASFGATVQNLAARLGRQLFQKAITEVKKFVQEYDAAMTQIQMITLKSDDQIASLGQNLIQTALDLKVDVSSVTSAASNLYRQGLSDEEVATRMEDVIKFSKVANISSDDASKIITTAIQNNLVEGSGEAMDALVALGDTAATTASELSRGMQKSAAAANESGVSYGELITLLTIGTSKTQLGGANVGTALNTLFYRLYKVGEGEDYLDENGNRISSTATSRALARAGVDIYDKNGSFRGAYDILTELGSRWNGLDDTTQSLILTQLGMGRQRNNIATLLQGLAEDNGELANRYLSTASTSSGITDKKYEAYLDSLQAKLSETKTSFDQLISTFETAGTASAFLGVLTSMIQGLTALNTYTEGAAGAFLGLAVAIAAVSAALYSNPVIAGIALAAVGIASIASGIGTLIKANDPNVQYQQQLQEQNERYENYTNKSFGRIDSIQQRIDEIDAMAKSIEDAGDAMDAAADSELGDAIKDLISSVPELTATFDESKTALENWGIIAKTVKGDLSDLNNETIQFAEILNAANYRDIDKTTKEALKELNDEYQVVSDASSGESNVITFGDRFIDQLYSTHNNVRSTLDEIASDLTGGEYSFASSLLGITEPELDTEETRKNSVFGKFSNGASLQEIQDAYKEFYDIYKKFRPNGIAGQSLNYLNFLSGLKGLSVFDKDGNITDLFQGYIDNGERSFATGSENLNDYLNYVYDTLYRGIPIPEDTETLFRKVSGKGVQVSNPAAAAILATHMDTQGNVKTLMDLEGQDYIDAIDEAEASAFKLQAYNLLEWLYENGYAGQTINSYYDQFGGTEQLKHEFGQLSFGEQNETVNGAEISDAITKLLYETYSGENDYLEAYQSDYQEKLNNLAETAIKKYISTNTTVKRSDINSYAESALFGYILSQHADQIAAGKLEEVINYDTQIGTEENPGTLTQALALWSQDPLAFVQQYGDISQATYTYNGKGYNTVEEVQEQIAKQYREITASAYEQRKAGQISKPVISYDEYFAAEMAKFRNESQTGLWDAVSAGADVYKTTDKNRPKYTADKIYERIKELGINTFEQLQEKQQQGEIEDLYTYLANDNPELANWLNDYVRDRETGEFKQGYEQYWDTFIRMLTGASMSYAGTNVATRIDNLIAARNALTSYQSGLISGVGAPGYDELKGVVGDRLAGIVANGEQFSEDQQELVNLLLNNYGLGLTSLTTKQKASGISTVRRRITEGTLNDYLQYAEDYVGQVMSGFSRWGEYSALLRAKETDENLYKDMGGDEELKKLERELDQYERDINIKIEVDGIQSLEEAGSLLEGTSKLIEGIKKGGTFAIKAKIEWDQTVFNKEQIARQLTNGTYAEQMNAIMSLTGWSEDEVRNNPSDAREYAEAKVKSSDEQHINSLTAMYNSEDEKVRNEAIKEAERYGYSLKEPAMTEEEAEAFVKSYWGEDNWRGYYRGEDGLWYEKDIYDISGNGGDVVSDFATWLFNFYTSRFTRDENAIPYRKDAFISYDRKYSDIALAAARKNLINHQLTKESDYELYQAVSSTVGQEGTKYLNMLSLETEKPETYTQQELNEQKRKALREATISELQVKEAEGLVRQGTSQLYEQYTSPVAETREQARKSLSEQVEARQKENELLETMLSESFDWENQGSRYASQLGELFSWTKTDIEKYSQEENKEDLRAYAETKAEEFSQGLEQLMEALLDGIDIDFTQYENLEDLSVAISQMPDISEDSSEAIQGLIALLEALGITIDGILNSGTVQSFTSSYEKALGTLDEQQDTARAYRFLANNAGKASSLASERGMSIVDAFADMSGWNYPEFFENNTTAAAMLSLLNGGYINAKQFSGYANQMATRGQVGQSFYDLIAGAAFGDVFSGGNFNAEGFVEKFNEIKEAGGPMAAMLDLLTEKYPDLTRAAEGSVDALDDVNEQFDTDRVNEASEYSDAIEGIGSAIAGLKAGGMQASQAVSKIRSSMNVLQDQYTAFTKAKGENGAYKKGASLDETTRDMIASMFNDISGKDLQKYTAKQMKELLEPLENSDYFNDVYSDTLQAMFDELQIAEPTIDLQKVKAVVNGDVDISEFKGVISDTAYEILQEILNLQGDYGAIELVTDKDGNIIDIKGVLEGTDSYHGGGGGGGGKSAAQELIDEWKNKMTPYTHEITLVEKYESHYQRAGDWEGYFGSLNTEYDATIEYTNALKDAIADLEEEMAGVEEGSDDWYSLRDAVYSYQEALEDANEELYDLNQKRITAIETQQSNADIGQTHEKTMLETYAGMALSQEHYADWYANQDAQLANIGDTISQNKSQLAEWYEELQRIASEEGTESENYYTILQKINAIEEENVSLLSEELEIQQAINEQRLAQIASTLTYNTGYATHNQNVSQAYGTFYQNAGYRSQYEKELQNQAEANRTIKEETEAALEAARAQMNSLEEGTVDWYKARDAVYGYQEALAQAEVTEQEIAQMDRESKIAAIEEKYTDKTRDAEHVNNMLSAYMSEYLDTGDYEAYYEAVDKYVENIGMMKTASEEALAGYKQQYEEGMAVGILRPAEQRALLDKINAEEEKIENYKIEEAQKQRDKLNQKTNKLLDDISWEDSEAQHNLTLTQYDETRFQNAGELTNQNTAIAHENELRKANKTLIEDQIKRLKEQAKAYEDNEMAGTDEYQKLIEQIRKKEEALKAENNQIEKNNDLMEENRKKINSLRKAVEDSIIATAKELEQREEDKTNNMVTLQNNLIEVMRNRYKEEWNLQKQTIQREKEALNEYKNLINERFNYRRNAANQADQDEEIAELKRQAALIAADPTRSKEYKELQQKISDMEKERAWNTSEELLNAENERIDNEISAKDLYISDYEEELSEFLSDARNFTDELNKIITDSYEDTYNNIIEYYKQYNTAFIESLPEAQAAALNNLEDTVKAVFHVLDDYQDLVDSFKTKEDFLEYIKQTDEYMGATETGRTVVLDKYADAWDDWTNATKNDYVPGADHTHNLGTIESAIKDLEDNIFKVQVTDIKGDLELTDYTGDSNTDIKWKDKSDSTNQIEGNATSKDGNPVADNPDNAALYTNQADDHNTKGHTSTEISFNQETGGSSGSGSGSGSGGFSGSGSGDTTDTYKKGSDFAGYRVEWDENELKWVYRTGGELTYNDAVEIAAKWNRYEVNNDQKTGTGIDKVTYSADAFPGKDSFISYLENYTDLLSSYDTFDSAYLRTIDNIVSLLDSYESQIGMIDSSTNTSIGDIINNITINADIDSDQDIKELTEKITDEINKNLAKAGLSLTGISG